MKRGRELNMPVNPVVPTTPFIDRLWSSGLFEPMVLVAIIVGVLALFAWMVNFKRDFAISILLGELFVGILLGLWILAASLYTSNLEGGDVPLTAVTSVFYIQER